VHIPEEWLARGMNDKESRNTNNLPADEHLREDVAPGAEADQAALQEGNFLPGQTNAGQQVAGLASATGNAGNQDPEEDLDSNNPV
jgi:hypothetical protein